jgi:hypothetical protein
VTIDPNALAVFCCVAGLILFLLASSRLRKNARVADDPLRIAGLTTSQRRQIAILLLRKTLPEDEAQKALTFKSAEFAARTGTVSLRWQPFLFLGVILFLCGFYPFNAVSIVAVVIQWMVLLIGIVTDVSDRRRVRNCRELISKGTFGTP